MSFQDSAQPEKSHLGERIQKNERKMDLLIRFPDYQFLSKCEMASYECKWGKKQLKTTEGIQRDSPEGFKHGEAV